MKKSLNFLTLFGLMSLSLQAQVNYFSLNGATNFSNPSSWTIDPTGATSVSPPAALTNADNFLILAGSTMTLNANATVRQLTNNGTLIVAANTLNIELATGNKAIFSNSSSATLNISGGAIRVKGNVTMAGRFIQSGGDLFIDGNSGTTGAATNPTTSLFTITSTQALEVTGGSWTFPDPSGNTTTTNGASECIYYNTATSSLLPATHTLKLGDGISTQAGGNTNGFRLNLNVAIGGRLHLGSLIFNALSGTNRFSTYPGPPAFTGDVTVISGECRINSTTYIGGSINVNSGATLTCTSSVFMVNTAPGFGQGNLFSSAPVSITNNGTIRSSTAPTANSPQLFVLYIGNNHPSGVTLNSPLRVGNFAWASVNGEYKGIVNSNNTNYLRLVNTGGLGIVNSAINATTGASGDSDAYIKGPFEISLGIGFSNVDNKIVFPVGQDQFTPVSLFGIDAAPSAITTIRVNPKTGNSGTLSSGLSNLSTNHFEISFVGTNSLPSSGMKIGIGASNITGSHILVRAATMNGSYDVGGGSCTFVAAPTTTYSANFSNCTNQIAASSLGAHYSYAETTQNPVCATITSPIAASVESVNPIINWSTAIGATNYDLYLSTTSPAYDASNPNANLVGNFTTTSYEITAANPLLANTNYYVLALAKNANGIATACAESSFTTGVYVRYCAPTFNQFGCSEGDVIARIQLNTLDNNSGTNCTSGTTGYTDYRGYTVINPSLTTTLNAGSTYQCTVWAGRFAQTYAAWIDFDNNGQFETSERIGFTTSTVAGSGQNGVLGSSVAFPISLPCNASTGARTMRVRSAFNTAGSTLVPCGPSNGSLNNFGEAEDYLITIAPAPSCPAPANLSATVGTPAWSSYVLDWTVGCGETAWDVFLQPSANAIVPTSTTTPTHANVSTHPITVTVASGTAQEFWVRAICNSATNHKSVWTGPFSFTSIIAPPSCATLNTPANAATNVPFSSNLEWAAPTSGGTVAGYKVYWAAGTLPTSPTNTVANNVLSWTPPLTIQANTNYAWKIVPYNSTGDATGCLTNTYTTEQIGLPACSNLISPANNSTTFRNPTFTWAQQYGVNSYKLYIASNSANLASPANLIADISTNSYDLLNNTLLSNTLYYWIAVPENAAGSPANCGINEFTTNSLLQHCAPQFAGTSCTEIKIFNIYNLSNTSQSNCMGATSGYSDYRPQQGANVELYAGFTYISQITPDPFEYPSHYAIWLDGNDDGFFDNSEKIAYSNYTPGSINTLGQTVSISVPIPCDIPSGNHTLRIRASSNSIGLNMQPCSYANGNSPDFGEVEDYLVNVLCPVVNTISVENLTSTTATLKWQKSCTNTNYDLYIGNLAPIATTTPTYSALIDTFINLTGLIPNTVHKVWIRTVCNNSTWVLKTFSTPSLPTLTLDLKLNLSGYNNTNNDYLKTLADFPLSDPYSAAPLNNVFIHQPPRIAATVPTSVLAATGNASIVDWVWLELREGVAGASSLVRSEVGLLRADGKVVRPSDGVSSVQFPSVVIGNYFVVVRHRNHLSFGTATAIPISTNTPLIDFTTSPQNLFGYVAGQQVPLAQIASNVYAMIGGDANFDNSIDAFDSIVWETQNGLFDNYINNADYNLDGSIDAFDSITWELHNGKYAITP